MQNQPFQNSYIPTKCWKCNAQNNLAQTRNCRNCRSYLLANNGRGFANKKSRRSALISSFAFFAIAILAILGILFFFMKRDEKSGAYIFAGFTTRSYPKNANVMPNGWFKPTLQEIFRKYPTIEEIIQKNAEATKSISSHDEVETFSIYGKFSVSKGECFRTKCEEPQKTQTNLGQFPTNISVPDNTINVKTMEISKNAFERTYEEIGTIECQMKKPDKLLRRIIVKNSTAFFNSSEITEVFNAGKGWKETAKLSEFGTKINRIQDLDAGESVKLKEDLSAIQQNRFFGVSNIEFQGTERIIDKVAYVVTRQNKDLRPETLYFDSVSGHLIKTDLDQFSVFYSDFSESNGTILPHTIYYRYDKGTGFYLWLKFEVFEWKVNEGIEDSNFERHQEYAPDNPTKAVKGNSKTNKKV